jgi:hypothetical protein
MSTAELKELRRIRAALERPSVEPVYVDYATAAKMLCCSKRSIERLVSEKRLKTYDIAGPKLRVSDLRALGEPRRRVTRKARQEQELEAVAEEAQQEGQGG